MWSFVIVELDSVADCAAGVRETLEAVTIDALLFQRADQALYHSILLRVSFPLEIGHCDVGERGAWDLTRYLLQWS